MALHFMTSAFIFQPISVLFGPMISVCSHISLKLLSGIGFIRVIRVFGHPARMSLTQHSALLPAFNLMG